MSGHSYDLPCPVCNESMDVSAESRPFDMVSGECLNCGFNYWTTTGRQSLKEINERRKELEIEEILEVDYMKHNSEYFDRR